MKKKLERHFLARGHDLNKYGISIVNKLPYSIEKEQCVHNIFKILYIDIV